MERQSRTITLSDRGPIKIYEDEWIPKFSVMKTEGTAFHLTVRTRKSDQQCVVYATQKKKGAFKPEYFAGWLCSQSEVSDTILDVAEEMLEISGRDEWQSLQDDLLSRLEPVEI